MPVNSTDIIENAALDMAFGAEAVEGVARVEP